MKVVLKENVEHLGRIGDVVDVKPGYARNYLLPRGLALRVGPGVMQEIEARRRREAERQKEELKELQAVAEQLASASVTITAKVNEEGRLFGSVSGREIAAGLQADGFARIRPEMIALEEPIKEPGVFEVEVRLTAELAATCKVWVVPEE